MTTLFKSFADGQCPNLKFAPGLVLGWLTVDLAMGIETRYALHRDGRVFYHDAPLGNTEFAPKGGKWIKGGKVPDNAEFIGNYKF